MGLRQLQQAVLHLYRERGYDEGPRTLVLDAMAELGELAQAILLTECVDFKPTPKKLGRDDLTDVAHEVGDVITYLLGLCNKLGIEPSFGWADRPEPTQRERDLMGMIGWWWKQGGDERTPPITPVKANNETITPQPTRKE